MASLLFLSRQVLAALPSLSLGFGTSTTGFDNQAEHEKITRAALKCPADDDASGKCFSPDFLDQLAGHILTFGAVGNPDDPFLWGTTLEAHPAHCDMADFFDGPDYPQSRDVATGILLECLAHIHGRFGEAIDAAAEILDDDGYIIPDEAEIPLGTGCIFTSAVTSSNSKCSAILGFGRALHGVQDFYSHSNWADEANASEPISVTNPPGLLNTALAPFLDYRFVGPPFIPYNLSTGCWTSPDLTPGVKECAGRVSHNSLNKDGSTGAPTEEKGPRALVGTNFDRAVHMAFEETSTKGVTMAVYWQLKKQGCPSGISDSSFQATCESQVPILHQNTSA